MCCPKKGRRHQQGLLKCFSSLSLLGPQYFKYEFPAGVDSAIIKVTSSTAFPCSVISVQDILVSEVVGCLQDTGGSKPPFAQEADFLLSLLLPSAQSTIWITTWLLLAHTRP